MRVPCDRISMSVQEYLSAPPPQMATRWMGMRRALLALALAAAVAIAGVAAYVYMYEGSLDLAVQDDSGAWAHVWVTFTEVRDHDAADRGHQSRTVDRREWIGLDLHAGAWPDHGRVNRDPHRHGAPFPFISSSEPPRPVLGRLLAQVGVFRTVQPKDEERHDDDEENPRDCEDAIRQGGEAPEVGAESGIDHGTEEHQDDPNRSDPHNQGSDRNRKA